MDAVINGEVCEKSSESNKGSESDLIADENPEVITCNTKDVLKKNLSPCNSPSPEITSLSPDKNLPHHITNNEEKMLHKNGSADDLSKIDSSEIEAGHSAPANSVSVSKQSDTLSAKEDYSEELSGVSVKSEVSSDSDVDEIKSTSCSTAKETESLIIDQHSDEMQLCEKAVTNENLTESSIASKNSESDACEKSMNSSNNKNDEDIDIIECSGPSFETSLSKSPDHHSSGKLNLNTFSSAKLAEQTTNNASGSVSEDEVNAKEHSNSVNLESKLPNFSDVNLHNKISNNESSPLEQLNQHLKSIGYNDGEISNNSLSKVSDQCSDTNKTESSKICPKDNSSPVDRHKESNCFVFTEISKEESGFPDVFTGLVVIGKYLSVKGDFTLRSSEALVESASLTSPYLVKEPDTFPPRLNDSKLEPKDFFHSTAGEMLIGIGLGRVSEWYHRDMARIKKRQMKREGKSPQLEEDLKMHESFYSESKRFNRIYSFSLKTCKTCGFKTESSIVMEGHLLVPHITPRREYQCNFCEVVNRDPKAMLEHMYRIHGKTGRIQPPVLFFECPYCTFESNSKVKLGNHLGKCQRIYDPSRNQAPPKDFEFPALTPKPITVAVVKAYEKSLCSMQRGRGRPKKIDTVAEQLSLNQYTSSINHSPLVPSPIPPYRASSTTPLSENMPSMPNQMIPPLQMPNLNLRPPHSNLGQLRPGLPSPMHLSSANRFYQVVNSSPQLMPMLSNNPLVTSPSQFPFSPNLVNTNSLSKKGSSPAPQFLNSFFGSGLRQQNPPKNVPEVTITPLPKLQGPYPVPLVKPSSTPSNNSSSQSNSLVVCEICDGYIKDLEQLRSHMQLIHKVKIHPKMLVSRPPLNCQKCQWRFFTDQGLERHLLGAHGLVTSNMQELANKSKDAGCCTICGRVYASKLVSHMNQVHKLTLKPAHLSYKCTVCSATFNLYRLFENHVYLVHSGAAKRPADSSSNSSKKLKSVAGDIDSPVEGEPKNHSEKRTSEENLATCTECGKQFRKHAAQSDKCEKCLKCDVSQGTHNSKMS